MRIERIGGDGVDVDVLFAIGFVREDAGVGFERRFRGGYIIIVVWNDLFGGEVG